MINNVVLVGRITRDLELRKTVSGQSVVNFTLAVNRQFSGPNGEREADFINCVVWSKIAENMVRFVGRGSLVGIEGSIRTRNYEGADGKRVYITEVLCSSVQFLESRNSRERQSNQANDMGYYQDPPAFANQTNDNQNFFQIPEVDLDEQFGKHPSTIDISDDDVPF